MSDASTVVIFRTYDREPVFHIWGGESLRTHEVERDDGSIEVTKRWVTACGQRIAEWGWTYAPAEPDWLKRHTDQWDSGHRGIELRRDHAEMFARLCERCAVGG